jgi:hypothetical protein
MFFCLQVIGSRSPLNVIKALFIACVLLKIMKYYSASATFVLPLLSMCWHVCFHFSKDWNTQGCRVRFSSDTCFTSVLGLLLVLSYFLVSRWLSGRAWRFFISIPEAWTYLIANWNIWFFRRYYLVEEPNKLQSRTVIYVYESSMRRLIKTWAWPEV